MKEKISTAVLRLRRSVPPPLAGGKLRVHSGFCRRKCITVDGNPECSHSPLEVLLNPFSIGCSKRPSSKAAASEGPRRTLEVR